jgi:hypothetical protein
MRVAFEDLVGAGAVIASLGGEQAPEAQAAAACFQDAKGDLQARLLACPSGAELVGRGFEKDVLIAAELDASPIAPMLMLHRTTLSWPRSIPGACRQARALFRQPGLKSRTARRQAGRSVLYARLVSYRALSRRHS